MTTRGATPDASSRQAFERFRELLARETGIVIDESKRYLVENRLGRLIVDEGLDGLEDVVKKMTSAGGREFKTRVIDVMTTNETQWFRDRYPFEALRQIILPELGGRTGSLRIWSAACSTGQEPYSLSMILEAYRQQSAQRVDARIVATDLSETALHQAREGIYDQFSILRGLDRAQRDRFFTPVDAKRWRVRDAVRRRVEFRRQNLLESFTGLGRFDVVFLRNVLIYFSQEVRQDILRRLTAQMNAGGYLVLGASESLGAMSSSFEMVRVPGGGIVYRRKA